MMLADSAGGAGSGCPPAPSAPAGDDRAQRGASLIDDTVARLLSDFGMSGWKLGARAGSETDLLSRHGVGRNTLREAIRLLETDGVVQMRAGPGGGLFLVGHPGEMAQALIKRRLIGMGVSVLDLWTVDAVLLAEAVELAAHRLPDDDIQMLRNLAGALTIHPEAAPMLEGRLRLRREIARLSGNRLLEILVTAISDLSQVQIPPDWLMLEINRQDIARSLALEKAMVEAIVSGDASAARHLVNALVDHDRSQVTNALERGDVPWLAHLDPPEPPDAKRATETAARMRADITRLGVGGVWLGSEQTLALRYGVGRVAVRQAIRLLDDEGRVQVRLGNGGGLFTRAPDVAGAMARVADYARYDGVTPAYAQAVRSALDLAAAPICARRRPGTAMVAGDDAMPASASKADLSLWLGRMSGNPVIHALSSLANLIDGQVQPLDEAALIRLRTAIASGDEGLARRRLMDMQS